MSELPMTREGYEKLKERLRHLEDVERPRLEKALGDAREMGDLSENSEFDAAREGLWLVDQQVSELKDRLSRASILDPSKLPHDSVAIGASVTVKDTKSGDKEMFHLVGEGEGDPMNDKISVMTPIGQALLGHKVGDTVEAEVPVGKLKFKILKIEYGNV